VSGGQVTAISITDPVQAYNTTNFVPPLLPVITIGGPGTGASAQATITNGTVGHITVTSGGSYTQAPQVLLMAVAAQVRSTVPYLLQTW